MPYIAEKDRERFTALEDQIAETPPKTAGEMQYLIAIIVGQYMLDTEYRYQNMNDVMGAISGAQQEFYRRHVAPYEDECIKKNGDVSINYEIEHKRFHYEKYEETNWKNRGDL